MHCAIDRRANARLDVDGVIGWISAYFRRSAISSARKPEQTIRSGRAARTSKSTSQSQLTSVPSAKRSLIAMTNRVGLDRASSTWLKPTGFFTRLSTMDPSPIGMRSWRPNTAANSSRASTMGWTPMPIARLTVTAAAALQALKSPASWSDTSSRVPAASITRSVPPSARLPADMIRTSGSGRRHPQLSHR